MTDEPTMIVIGAGLAGLSTGCYAQMSGYRSKIFEMHSIAGGCCTAWKRKEFIFDWCICWMLGTGPDNEMNQIWRELGALQGKRIKDFDVFNTVVGPNGEKVHFYVDPDRLEQHLLDISPADAKLIRRFCRDLRMFREVVDSYPFLKPVGLMSFRERARMLLSFLPHYRAIMKSHGLLMTDFSSRFQSPFLREALNYIFFDKHPTFPLLPFYFNLAAAANRNAGCPEGGSLGVAQSIEERYHELGGEIVYRSKVARVLVENDRAVGVELSDGQRHFADVIVSAGDAYSAVQRLLGGRYKTGVIQELFDETIDEQGMIYPGWATIFLGVNRDLSGELHSVSYLLSDAEAGRLPGCMHRSMMVQIRNIHFPDHCPPGKSVIQVSYFSDHDHWARFEGESGAESRSLHTRRPRSAAYEAEKEKAGEFVVRFLDGRYPGLREAVEWIDVSTPLTLVRYTGNHRGSVLAWDPFNRGCDVMEKYVAKQGPTLPGLAGFYLAGHWATTGGVIRAAASGRHVMQFICRDAGREFRAWATDAIPRDVGTLALFRRAHRPRAVAARTDVERREATP